MENIYKIISEVPESDYEKIVDFLRKHWKSNHAFVKSKDLLDFQHLDKDRNVYHFIVAENQQTKEYDALTGYIPTWQYDRSLQDGDYWGAIWKRREDVNNDEGKTLGLDLFMTYLELPNLQSHGGISLSNDAFRWYKKLRWGMDYMHHYYIINNKCQTFNLADNVCGMNFEDASVHKDYGWKVDRIRLEDLKDNAVKAVYRPRKTVEFLRNRYMRHPVYHYDYFGLYHESSLKAIFVTRDCVGNGGKVIRIVDVLGELGGYIYPSIQEILQEGEYEYADFLNYGIDKRIISEMGFKELDFDEDKLILPNYFEPFERKNVKMTVVYKSKFPYVAFKGDADQDRPNVL